MNSSASQDPNSNLALGRKIRLKNLLDEGLQIESTIAEQNSVDTLQKIRQIITASDDIIAEGSVEERAEHTTEVVMDAQVLKMNHELVSKVLLQSSDFNYRMYQNALNNLVFSEDSVNWDVITDIVCSVARTARTKSSMLGAVELDPKQRNVKERQQRRRTEQTEEKRPETIDNLKRQDKGAQKVNIVYDQVAQIFKANNRQPVPYYKLIIDPNNFMNTVENAFQTAFLARDNILAIETGEDKYPHVRLATPDERKTEKETSQSICTLNLKLCQEMILFYNIREAMLKVPNEAEES